MNEDVAPNRVPDETLDFILDWVRGAPDRQLRDAEALDSKPVPVFGAAAVVIGLTSVSEGRATLTAWLLVPAVVAFLVTAGFTFWAIRVQQFRVSDNANQLWYRYWSDPVTEIKHAILDDLARGFGDNEGILGRKRRAVLGAVAFAALQVFLVGAALIESQI